MHNIQFETKRQNIRLIMIVAYKKLTRKKTMVAM